MGFFSDIGNGIKSAASSIWSEAKKIKPKEIVNTVYSDVKSGVSAVANHVMKTQDSIVNGTVNTVNHVVDKGSETIESLGSSLSMPLMLIGGAAALYMLTQKK
jgi:hypothetical protein